MSDKYRGDMPDSFFRRLSDAEETTFRQWARDNWSPAVPENFGVMHPVIRDEWQRIDLWCDTTGKLWPEE